MSEAALQRSIMVACTGNETRLWRNNTGSAWQGRVTRNRDGSITIRDPRPVTFGLSPGSSDIIGLRVVTVTHEMVGHQIGVFIALEVKLPTNSDRPEDQRTFIGVVNRFGGRGAFVTSVEQAQELLK